MGFNPCLSLLLLLVLFELAQSCKPLKTGNLTCQNKGEHGKVTCEDSCGEPVDYENKSDEVLSITDPLWVPIFLAVCSITCLSGMMSGLTLGLMGMDEINLKILTKSGTSDEKVYAKRILPLVERHHLLLVTLLFMNAICMESLPILLERLVGHIFAVIISVSLILLFGEVIPQSICVRYGLAIGGNLFWLVWMFVFISLPVAWPISKLLDIILGDNHTSLFNRTELKELVSMHGQKIKSKAFRVKSEEDVSDEDHTEETLMYDEITIIRGALDMRTKTVKFVQTPLNEVFMLSLDQPMNRETMETIVSHGYSRIPIYLGQREHVIGMLLVKHLLLVDPEEGKLIKDLPLMKMPTVTANKPLYETMNIFQTGKSHMALVVHDNDHSTPLGIVSLEDIIEELIQEEIQDETDFRRSEKAKNEGGETSLSTSVELEDDGFVV